MSTRITTRALVLASAIALFPAAASAQPAATARQKPPAVGPERPFTFPSHATAKLENGLTIFVVEDRRQPVVSASLMMPGAGASATTAKEAGLAAMTAALVRQGTATRSAQQIAEAIDSVGGSLTAGAGLDTTQASVTVVTSALDVGFELLADVVQRPAFAPQEIDRWKRQTLSNLQVAYSDPEYLRDVVAQRLAFGMHAYGYPTDGVPSTVQALTRDAVVKFHKEHYTPAGAFLAIAGDITPEAATALARKHFGGWAGSAPAAAPAPPAAPATRRVVVVDQPDAVQTQFGMAGSGVPRSHPDWLALSVANQILGGSFNSRLNLRLRAKEGLTYGAGSAIESYKQAGVWDTTSFTRTEETANAMKVMLEVLTEFRKNPATPAELAEATSYLSGVFALQVETASAVAGRVLTSALNGLPPDYWQTYRDRVKKISAQDVQGAVERHVNPEQLTIVAVGNAGGFAKGLDPLGAVTIVPASSLDLLQPELVAGKETPAGPQARARAMELIKAAADAQGGAAKLAAVKDVTTTGAMTITTPNGDLRGDARTVIVHPDKLRSVVSLEVGEMVQVFDGTATSMTIGGQSLDLPPVMATEMRRAVLLNGSIGVLRDALAGTAEVAALEPKAIDGVTYDRVSWKKGDVDMVLAFDPKSHLLTIVNYRGATMEGMADSEVRFSDFKPAAGLTLPMRYASFQNGQQVVAVTIKEWQINTGVTAESITK